MLRDFGRIVELSREGQRSASSMVEAQRLLERMVHDSQRHFAEEEALLRFDQIPNGEAHRRAHQSFLANLQRVASDFQAQVSGVMPLVDSLVDHIKTMDSASLASVSHLDPGGSATEHGRAHESEAGAREG